MKIIWFFNKIRRKLIKILIHCVFGKYRIALLRWYGVKIGKNCEIFSVDFSTEPYLIEIGDHVSIASGTRFLTHDGSVWVLSKEFSNVDIFGTIKIGNNTHIGLNTLIMPNSSIGSNCVIGAGSVVRGIIPDNTVAIGNPAKVIMSTEILKSIILNNKHRLDSKYFNDQNKARLLKKHFNIKQPKDRIN